jgi:DNA-binding XRE family transcriptional regulator
VSIQVDPRKIRTVLALIGAGLSKADAARQAGVARKSINRWEKHAADRPGWPTDADIAAWLLAHTGDGDRRRRASAAHSAMRRKRAYLGLGPLLVDATGTARRLQALAALGWSMGEVAVWLGVSRQRASQLSVMASPFIQRARAEDVARLYDRLSTRIPPPTPLRDHQRSQAARKHWALPMQWDEDTIDNPAAKPLGVRRQPSRAKASTEPGLVDPAVVLRILEGDYHLPANAAERTEVARRWVAADRTLFDLQARTGWRRIDRHFQLAGQPHHTPQKEAS